MADETKKEQDKPASITYDGEVSRAELGRLSPTPDISQQPQSTQEPLQITYEGDVSRAELGRLSPTPQWKVDAHIQASSRSDAERKADAMWQQRVDNRAKEYIQADKQGRAAQHQAQSPAEAAHSRSEQSANRAMNHPQTTRRSQDAIHRAQSQQPAQAQQTGMTVPRQQLQSSLAQRNQPEQSQMSSTPAQEGQDGNQQQARGRSVFERYGPTQAAGPAQENARSQADKKPERPKQTQQTQASQNVFDKHRPQRDTQSKQQQQTKGKDRER